MKLLDVTPEETTERLLDGLEDASELAAIADELPPACVYDELAFVHREAAATARLAFDRWCGTSDRDAYAAYRAAQDRADAAQDALGRWACRDTAA